MPPASSLQSVYAFILFHARLNPQATAVVHESAPITYAEFCMHVERVTRRLRAAAIAPASRVAVHVDSPYLRWLAVLALGRLQLLTVTLSVAGTEWPIVQADAVVGDASSPVEAKHRVAVDSRWYLDACDDLPVAADAPRASASPFHVILSSGTTGRPKMALFTLEQLRGRISGAARAYGIHAATRLMVMMGQNTLGGYVMPLTCWAAGGTVVLPHLPRGKPMTHLLKQQPNVIVMAPAQLAALVDSLPPDAQPVRDFVVYVGGAELTRALSRRTRLRLTPALYVIYGSTEAGSVSLAHAAAADARPGFTGHVLPTALVEIVDEQDRPLAPGKAGEVRIRSDAMVSGYLGEADGTGGPLRDGWFYPGDSGTLDAEGGLAIIGRTRELMNLGGSKVAPSLVEEALAGVPGVEDLAAFAIDSPRGGRPGVAVVAGEGFSEELLARRYRQAFATLPPLIVARVAAIPRSDMGKVKRTELAASVGRAARRVRGVSAA